MHVQTLVELVVNNPYTKYCDRTIRRGEVDSAYVRYHLRQYGSICGCIENYYTDQSTVDLSSSIITTIVSKEGFLDGEESNIMSELGTILAIMGPLELSKMISVNDKEPDEEVLVTALSNMCKGNRRYFVMLLDTLGLVKDKDNKQRWVFADKVISKIVTEDNELRIWNIINKSEVTCYETEHFTARYGSSFLIKKHFLAYSENNMGKITDVLDCTPSLARFTLVVRTLLVDIESNRSYAWGVYIYICLSLGPDDQRRALLQIVSKECGLDVKSYYDRDLRERGRLLYHNEIDRLFSRKD